MTHELRPGIKFKTGLPSDYGVDFFIHRSPPMIEEMDAFLRETKGMKRLLDVGAFHGIFSLAFCAAEAEREAVAIEPSSKAYPELPNNIMANPGLSIRVSTVAFSDRKGKMQMTTEWDHVVSKTFITESSLFETVMVDGMTGDQFCAEWIFKPEVIKVDVEGHELKVLRGLRETLRSFRPLIFLEVHPEYLKREGDSFDDFQALMDEMHYHACHISGTGDADLRTNEHVILRPV